MRYARFLICLLLSHAVCPTALAGVPQIIHPTTGQAIGWVHPEAIPYAIDPGPLGRLSPYQARVLVEAMMGVWEEVEAARMHFEFAGMLTEDVTAANIAEFVNGSICTDDLLPGIASMKAGISPIVFDDDGSIIDLLAGEGASRKVVGRSGLRCYEGSLADPVGATQAFVVMNGRFIDDKGDPEDLPVNAFTGIVLHELGHFLGLHHSMVNETLFADLIYERRSPEASRFLPVMYPLVYQDNVAGTVLKPDDVAAIASLYPTPDFAKAQASLSGVIADAAGKPFRGANVVARRTDDPWCQAVATISGRFCTPLVDATNIVNLLGQACTAKGTARGLYRLDGLTPGNYTIEVSEVANDAGARQNMFPRDYGADLPGVAEYYNGGDRSSEGDLPGTILTVATGATLKGLDIVLGPGRAASTKSMALPTYVAADGSPCVPDPVDYEELLSLAADEEEVIEPGVGDTPFASTGGGCTLVRRSSPIPFSPFWWIGWIVPLGGIGCWRLRRRRQGVSLVLCALCCATAVPAAATTFLPMTPAELAADAGTVFHGACIDLTVHTDERGLLVTDVVYLARRVVKGTAEGTVEFRVVGDATAQFAVGHDDILFLYPPSRWGLTSVVGGAQGYFPVTTTPDGAAIIRNPFVDGGRGRDANVKGIHAADRNPTPMFITPDAFLDRITRMQP